MLKWDTDSMVSLVVQMNMEAIVSIATMDQATK